MVIKHQRDKRQNYQKTEGNDLAEADVSRVDALEISVAFDDPM
jgi:hypothetical protein